MQIDSKFQKIEVNFVAAVAAVVAGVAFLLFGLFSAQDYSVSDASATTSQHSSPGSSAASHELQPALLEPALRSLDGVAHHG